MTAGSTAVTDACTRAPGRRAPESRPVRGRALPWLFAVLAVAACQRSDPPTPPAVSTPPAEAMIAAVPPAPATSAAPVSLAKVPPPVEALPEQSAACLAASSSAAAPSVAVHRWVDAAGITHYSDQPPAAAAKDHRVLEVSGLPPIAVKASGYDVNLPDQLEQRAVADALGVQRVMRDTLGVAAPPGLTLQIVFVRAADAYAQLVGEPALASSAGAYSTARQTIYVRMQAQDEASFTVLRHEITHALVHESIGNLPTSLNEGLAEYFGRYRAGGMGGQVDVGADRKGLIAAAPAGDGSDALVDLLARDGRDFYVDDAASTREQRYRRAYALVALLMQAADGRAVLARVLAAQRADPCRPVAVETLFESRYHGGLAALAAAWAAFMRDPPATIQAY